MSLTQLDSNTALVIIDLQQGIVAADTAPHSTGDVVARTVALADAFRARELPVVLVRVTSNGGDATPGRTDVSGSARDRPQGWDKIVDELSGDPDDIVVTKRNWGAFYGTDLDLQLRRRGITQIVLTGVATSMGVESTARAAHEHGYNVALVTDAMTDIRAEGHQRSVELIFPLLGETGTTADVLGALTGAEL